MEQVNNVANADEQLSKMPSEDEVRKQTVEYSGMSAEAGALSEQDEDSQRNYKFIGAAGGFVSNIVASLVAEVSLGVACIGAIGFTSLGLMIGAIIDYCKNRKNPPKEVGRNSDNKLNDAFDAGYRKEECEKPFNV